MEHDFVDKFEDELREVEKKLENLGASICSVQNGYDSWGEINKAVHHVQEAIHYAYKMRYL